MHPLPYSPSRFIGQIRCCYRQIEARLQLRQNALPLYEYAWGAGLLRISSWQ